MDENELKNFKEIIKTSSSIEKLLGEEEIKRWRIPAENLHLGDVVGRGAFGIVLHGHLIKKNATTEDSPLLRESDSGLDTSTYRSSDYHEFRNMSVREGDAAETTELVVNNSNTNGSYLMSMNSTISSGGDTTSSNVAIKKLPDNANSKNFYDHFKELKLMLHVGQHPHIINLIGYSIENSSLYIVTDYAKYGNLKDYLRNYQELREKQANNDTLTAIGESKLGELKIDHLMLYAYQVALGMEYLHSKKVCMSLSSIPFSIVIAYINDI
jgi:serine/threonine protein kinase